MLSAALSQDDLFIDKDGNALSEDERVIWIDIKIVPADDSKEFDYLWSAVFGFDANTDAGSGKIRTV